MLVFYDQLKKESHPDDIILANLRTFGYKKWQNNLQRSQDVENSIQATWKGIDHKGKIVSILRLL